MEENMGLPGAIFDLDGVIVDTAKYHYLAWKKIADELGFYFAESDNERLKGVSRMESLEILLEVGKITGLKDSALVLKNKADELIKDISAIEIDRVNYQAI